MSVFRSILKTVIPRHVRRYLRAQQRKYVFCRAIRKLTKDLQNSITPQENVISDLIYGWGNSWSVLEEYLSACIKFALASDGPILECGSGLTTVVLGVIAERSGNTVWSLEHNKEWSERVDRYLKKYQINSVRLCVNPLKDFTDFSWYDPPLDVMPDRFSMVICDGPPKNTRGGRYGLLPVMKSRFKPGTIILLDDAEREQEKAIATLWTGELNTSYEILGSKKPYILIIVSGSGDHQ